MTIMILLIASHEHFKGTTHFLVNITGVKIMNLHLIQTLQMILMIHTSGKANVQAKTPPHKTNVEQALQLSPTMHHWTATLHLMTTNIMTLRILLQTTALTTAATSNQMTQRTAAVCTGTMVLTRHLKRHT
ncbi:hypothetical protein M758_UG057000 [Ceratodon purpureus]|nr:hypothetical protein M758_UG057000 [Ceratodon purpureus]